MPKLSQETLAITGVGIGLAALILTSTAGFEARSWRSGLSYETFAPKHAQTGRHSRATSSG